MRGSYSFTVQNKDILFDITLTRNVTVIRGNGGSGKTTLCDMIRNSQKTGSGVHLKSYFAPVFVLDTMGFHNGVVQNYTERDAIFVTDEDESFVKSSEFAECVQQTGCYFVIITRDNLKCLPCSIKEIYTLVDHVSATGNQVVKTLAKEYPHTQYGNLDYKDIIVTEDLRAGKQFFSRTFLNTLVLSAKSKDNIINRVKQDNLRNAIIIVDGAAFGFLIEDTLLAIRGHNIALIAIESFEYAILKSHIVNNKVLSSIDLDSPEVDARRYLTWEQYYTDLLETVTKGSIYQYSKLALPGVYTQPQNRDAILQVYGLHDFYYSQVKNALHGSEKPTSCFQEE